MALTISDLANGTSTSSSASIGTGSTVTASVGDWLVAIVAADNAGTNGDPSLSSVSDSQGNTWAQRALINRDPGAANAGATLGIFTAPVTNALSSGTVTANFSPNTTCKAIQVYRVQPGSGEAVQFVAADATGTTGNDTTHSAGTVSVTNGDTIFGAAAIEARDAITGDSDTTNGSWSSILSRLADTGATANSMTCSSQYKTVSSTGNQSWACTTGANRDSARSYLILRAVTTAISGTASITEADDTASSAGTIALKGTASITEAADTSSATGKVALTGTASIAEAPDTISATGALPIVGTASLTEAADTVSATGALPIVGTLSVTEADDTLAATGTGANTGVAAIAEADDAASATGTIAVIGTLTATEADDTLAATGAIAIVGQVDATMADDGLSATGELGPLPVAIIHRPGAIDQRQELWRKEQEWQADLRRVIDQAFAVANGEIDPITLEPIPPPDFDGLTSALQMIEQARDQAAADTMMAAEARRQEEEAVAILLLAA